MKLVDCQIMNIYELLQAKREDILRTATKYGAYNIRIFGSVARKEADANSDVDFVVEMEPGRSLFDLGGQKNGGVIIQRFAEIYRVFSEQLQSLKYLGRK